MSYLTVAIVLFCLIKFLHGVPQPQTPREIFVNKTSYIRSPAVGLANGLGLGFRSCSGGQLFVQSSLYKNKISLDVTQESLTLSIVYQSRPYEAKIFGKFLDNKWHQVNLIVKPQELTFAVEDQHQVGILIKVIHSVL